LFFLASRQKIKSLIFVILYQAFQQDADGWSHDGHIEHSGIRQAAADAHGLCALEQVG
jgi:hypothetical protein